LAHEARLRISEVVSLKVKNVNFGKLTIHLENAKSNWKRDQESWHQKRRYPSLAKI